MAPRVSLNSRSGFTLIEFCVAVLIMMVGLLGLLQTVNMATLHNMGSLLRNEAISLADEQMVLAKTTVFDTSTFGLLADAASLINRKTRSGFANYSVNRSVTTASTNSKQIEVRVSWRYKGNKLDHRISSLVTSP